MKHAFFDGRQLQRLGRSRFSSHNSNNHLIRTKHTAWPRRCHRARACPLRIPYSGSLFLLTSLDFATAFCAFCLSRFSCSRFASRSCTACSSRPMRCSAAFSACFKRAGAVWEEFLFQDEWIVIPGVRRGSLSRTRECPCRVGLSGRRHCWAVKTGKIELEG